jgi:hypothetical protein
MLSLVISSISLVVIVVVTVAVYLRGTEYTKQIDQRFVKVDDTVKLQRAEQDNINNAQSSDISGNKTAVANLSKLAEEVKAKQSKVDTTQSDTITNTQVGLTKLSGDVDGIKSDYVDGTKSNYVNRHRFYF